jgi:hypothetical protein
LINKNGALLLGGKPAFPIGLSNPPPLTGEAPNGKNGLAEVAAAGVNMIRTGIENWSLQDIEAQIAAQKAILDAAQTHGLYAWLWLGNAPNLPASGETSTEEQLLLLRIAEGLKTHSALGAYKGYDEPRNPFRGNNWIRPAGLVRAYQRLKQLDPAHAVVITQAPVGTLAQLNPYRPAYDITGADIYPVSYPPGVHGGTANNDLSVVGDVTRKMVQTAGGKPVWMTLQIAWSGAAPSRQHPEIVPRFPSLHDERFMAYQAIINGARGLIFFGGHMTQIASPADATAGWNWSFWQQALRPLVSELTSTAVTPALLAAQAKASAKANAADIDIATRTAGKFLYVLAARRRSDITSQVTISGLPNKNDGTPLRGGQVLFEYVQDPLPPPIKPHQVFRSVTVTDGGFRDWFGPHDVHVYRFQH